MPLGVDGFHGVDEIVAGDRLTVVAPEVLLQPFTKAITAEQRVLHTNDFGAFLVNGGGIEVGYLLIAFGADRMSHRPAVLGKLSEPQCRYVVDTLHGACTRSRRALKAAGQHISGKFLISEYRQAFFQGEMEPVAASNPVTCPIMEVFVSYDCLYGAVGSVAGRRRVCKHVGGIEDIQALVFHRAHIEVARGHNHETVQVELQPIALFIPTEGTQEAVHGPLSTVFCSVVAIDLEQYLAAAACAYALLTAREVSCHNGKKVAGLGMRVLPDRLVPTIFEMPRGNQVAV